jgi:vesicle coat complex subunit
VLPDGTYKTASALELREQSKAAPDKAQDTSLRAFILRGDFFLCTAVATTLCKLALKSEGKLGTEHSYTLNALVLLYLNSFLRLGKSNVPPQPMDEDSYGTQNLFAK